MIKTTVKNRRNTINCNHNDTHVKECIVKNSAYVQ